MEKEQNEFIQKICNKCREEGQKQLNSKNLNLTSPISFETNEFWKILMNYQKISRELEKDGLFLENIVIESTFMVVNIQKVVNEAIQRWNDVCINGRNLKGLTIISVYDPREFQEISLYLPKIQEYAKTKHFEISKDCLNNRLLVTNI